VIVDGRFELAPESRVAELARGALCLGVTARTGPGLREALRVSTAARVARADLAIVWGGPHPTLDPRRASRRGWWTPAPSGPERSRWPRWRRPCGQVWGSTGRRASWSGVRSPAGPRAPDDAVATRRLLAARPRAPLRGPGGRRLDYCSSRARGTALPGWGSAPSGWWPRQGSSPSDTGSRRCSSRTRTSSPTPRALTRSPPGFSKGAPPLAGRGATGGRGGGGTERLHLVAESGCRKLRLGVRPGAASRELLMEAGSRLRAAGLVGGSSSRWRSPAAGSTVSSPPSRWPGRCAPSTGGSRHPSGGRGTWARAPRGRWRPGRPRGGTLVGSPRRAPAGPGDVLLRGGPARPGHRLGKHLVRLLALVRVRLGFFALDVDRLAVEAGAVLRTGRARRAPHGD